MTKAQEDTITWFQYNNIVGIVATAIMIATSFFVLKTQVALMEQKLDFLIEFQKNNEIHLSTVQNQVSINTLDIRQLQTKLGIEEKPQNTEKNN